ncbi:hypothetical protein [Microcoleus sp. LEGE 07076]|uniref:hypothetical protein n=1 Tax=Microcoleus sp. LEGE 07076 TaxID=915322 RepID=UPI001880B0AB|nr:hypothetical protein [Microcoleus sp. LEGE 07076]
MFDLKSLDDRDRAKVSNLKSTHRRTRHKPRATDTGKIGGDDYRLPSKYVAIILLDCTAFCCQSDCISPCILNLVKTASPLTNLFQGI